MITRTYVRSKKKMVTTGTHTAIVRLLRWASEAGCSGSGVTPDGGLRCGVNVGGGACTDVDAGDWGAMMTVIVATVVVAPTVSTAVRMTEAVLFCSSTPDSLRPTDALGRSNSLG